MNINQFFSNKRTVLLITGLFGVIIMLFIFRLFTSKQPQEITLASPKPTASAATLQNPSVVTSPSATNRPIIPTTYTPNELKRDADRINNKEQLTNKDQEVKKKLITPLLGKSGIIKTEALFQIEYVKSADALMVEIRSQETDQAKKAAEKYFLDAGLSQKGICNLPVVFYISSKVQTILINSGKTFDPVPDGC